MIVHDYPSFVPYLIREHNEVLLREVSTQRVA